MSRRKTKAPPPNRCGWCQARLRWATDEDSGERIPLDVATTTTAAPRYVTVPAGNVELAIRLPVHSARAGHLDHRSHCRSSVVRDDDTDDEPRTRRDLD